MNAPDGPQPRDRASAAPAVAAAVVLSAVSVTEAPRALDGVMLALMGLASFAVLAVAALGLGGWAAWCFRRDRFADGALLAVVAIVVAAHANPFRAFFPFLPVPLLAPVAVYAAAHWRARPAPALPWLPVGVFGWSGALAAALVALVAALAAWVAMRIAPVAYWLESVGEDVPWDLAVNAASGALLLGVGVEALFRGALQERLTRALGPWPAIALQSVAHAGVCYAGLGYFLWYGGLRGAAGAIIGLVVGFLLGVLRQLSGGLFAPWIANALANAAVAVVARVR